MCGCISAALRPCSSLLVILHTCTIAREVWLPVVSANEFASVATLQKLSALLPTTVDASEKMRIAHEVADSTTKMLVADRRTNEHRPKMRLC